MNKQTFLTTNYFLMWKKAHLISGNTSSAYPNVSFRAERTDAFSPRSLLFTLSLPKGERVGPRSRGISLRCFAQASPSLRSESFFRITSLYP